MSRKPAPRTPAAGVGDEGERGGQTNERQVTLIIQIANVCKGTL